MFFFFTPTQDVPQTKNLHPSSRYPAQTRQYPAWPGHQRQNANVIHESQWVRKNRPRGDPQVVETRGAPLQYPHRKQGRHEAARCPFCALNHEREEFQGTETGRSHQCASQTRTNACGGCVVADPGREKKRPELRPWHSEFRRLSALCAAGVVMVSQVLRR